MNLALVYFFGILCIAAGVYLLSYTDRSRYYSVVLFVSGGLLFLLPGMVEISEAQYDHILVITKKCSNAQLKNAVYGSLGQGGKIAYLDYHLIKKAHKACLATSIDPVKKDIWDVVSKG